MSYFKHFPLIVNYEVQGTRISSVDLTRRLNVIAESKNDPSAYIEYDVQNGESPEMIADRFYDNVGLFWVLMLFNDRYDIDNDWPLDQYSLDEYIKRKYENPNGIHHYRAISTGAIVNGTWPAYDSVPVTNYEYEVDINDKKRKIKVPLPEYALQIAGLHKKLIKQ